MGAKTVSLLRCLVATGRYARIALRPPQSVGGATQAPTLAPIVYSGEVKC